MVSHYCILAFKALVTWLQPSPPASYPAISPFLALFFPYWLSFNFSQAPFPPLPPSQHPFLTALTFWNAFLHVSTWPAPTSSGLNYNVNSSGRPYLYFQTNMCPHLCAFMDASYFSLQHAYFFASFMIRMPPSLDWKPRKTRKFGSGSSDI